MAGVEHKDPFPPRRLNARVWFSQGTFGGTHSNGREAPIPSIRPVVRIAMSETDRADGITSRLGWAEKDILSSSSRPVLLGATPATITTET